MNIALPILLLILGGLALWVLSESKLKWYTKSALISVFCVFTIIFWSSISSFLGWPAQEEDMPEKILIHWVIIKEPNKFTEFDGAIYILLESVEETEDSKVLKFFGYKKDMIEPRLYELSYSRELHERLENTVKGRLMQGQPVAGKLKKGEGQRKGEGKPDREGGGSESQKTEWEFHELLPSEIHEKPER